MNWNTAFKCVNATRTGTERGQGSTRARQMDGALMQCSEDCALIRASKRMRLGSAKEVSFAAVPDLIPVQELFQPKSPCEELAKHFPELVDMMRKALLKLEVRELPADIIDTSILAEHTDPNGTKRFVFRRRMHNGKMLQTVLEGAHEIRRYISGNEIVNYSQPADDNVSNWRPPCSIIPDKTYEEFGCKEAQFNWSMDSRKHLPKLLSNPIEFQYVLGKAITIAEEVSTGEGDALSPK